MDLANPALYHLVVGVDTIIQIVIAVALLMVGKIIYVFCAKCQIASLAIQMQIHVNIVKMDISFWVTLVFQIVLLNLALLLKDMITKQTSVLIAQYLIAICAMFLVFINVFRVRLDMG